MKYPVKFKSAAGPLHPNVVERGANLGGNQVSNQVNEIGPNSGVLSGVSINMIPSQVSGNSGENAQPPRPSIGSPSRQQRQENQGGIYNNIPGSMTLLTNIGTINPFRGSPTEDIQEWMTQFNWIANINHWSEDVRCALLPGYLEDVAKTWYSTLSVRDRGNYQVIQIKLLQAFQQVISPVQHLNQLLARTQSEQEPVETYAYNKLKLCEDLNKEMAEIDKVTYLIQGMKPQL